MADHGTPWVAIGVRILVDPGDPADVTAVNDAPGPAASCGPVRRSRSRTPTTTATAWTRRATPLLALAAGVEGFAHTFGRREAVDPVRHLLGTAAGWGGLPDSEAFYLNFAPGLPVGEYDIRVTDVPVDAFWSISMYNTAGFFEPNDLGAYSVNDLTAVKDADGAVTVRLGADPDRGPNFLPIGDGWNYIVRLYRPRPEILDGTWTFPSAQPAGG